jgi:hypothetical protein
VFLFIFLPSSLGVLAMIIKGRHGHSSLKTATQK